MQGQQQLSLLGHSGRTIQVPTAIHKAFQEYSVPITLEKNL